MKNSKGKKTFIGKIANELAEAHKTRAAGNIRNAQAKAIKAQGKAATIKAKADLVAAKQGAAKTRARAAAFSAAAGSLATSYSQANANKAMGEWISAINGNSSPAEGTGEPSPGSSGDENTTGNLPVGNYKKV